MNLTIHFRHKNIYIYTAEVVEEWGERVREKTRNDVSASHFEGCECLWCHLNDDLRQILPVVFPSFLMACGFLIGPLFFSSPLLLHTLVVLGYIASRSQKAEVQSVYGPSIYKPYIFTYTHLVELSGGSNIPYTQFMAIERDPEFSSLNPTWIVFLSWYIA